MRPILVVLISLTVGTGLITGCGSSSSSSAAPASSVASSTSTTHLAKTKFLLHAGLAFGAIHRYIYKPFRAGAFSGGLLHHKLATIKAALAAAFAFHEVNLALQDARSSKLLSTVLAPLLALQTGLSTLVTNLKHGHVDPSAITSANGVTGQAAQASAKAGQSITDLAVPQLGG